MRRQPFILALAAASTLAATTGASQARDSRRGAVIGGVIGAGTVGALGAIISQGVCDAADCSGAWIDGAVPGVVIGGIAGAAVGALIGALVEQPRAARPADPSARRRGIAALLELSTAEAESELVDQVVYGARAMLGVRLGGLFVGPSAERLAGNEWRISSLGLAARLDPGRGAIRPFAEATLGGFRWRYPTVLADCTVIPTSCTYRPGMLTDEYLGLAGAVGASVGDPDGRWRVYAQVRFHHAGGRPTGEPFSTTERQLRQLSLGGEINLGSR